MNQPVSTERYRQRLTEVESLKQQLTERPGDGAVVVGLLLEAAGDVLRRAGALGVKPETVTVQLSAISTGALRGWLEGLSLKELPSRLAQAASSAVEAALPDDDDAAEESRRRAAEGLAVRDRLESAVVALEALARAHDEARELATQLRAQVAKADGACRVYVERLTAINGWRRAEAALLDGAFRTAAWWFSDRTGIEDDELVRILGGEVKGSLSTPLQAASRQVTQRRSRPISSDELLRYDLGLASPAEREAISRRAENDPELKLALAALVAGDEAIDELAQESGAKVLSLPTPAERPSSVRAVYERAEFKVLVFRAKQNVQVVLQQGTQERFAAAAVYRDEAELAPVPGELGLHFNLGAQTGGRVRAVVKLAGGQTHQVEVDVD